PEVMNQITYKVIGNDLTVTLAAEAGQLQLNVMFPVIAQSLGESIEMLIKGMSILKSRCIEGITANKDRCRELVENSIGLVTVLVPELGYEVCSNLARQALVENKGIYELVLEKELLSQENLNSFLSLESMVGPLID
ncbi:MAG: aspartate ammonia-lyase, partial [Deltaproteobacteria bacterium]|nr:aspartate ammonia-lyase [Deltaproteobacteria bacterium]